MIVTFLNGFFLFSMPGGSEWILIVIIVLLMFGGKKIPELMRGIGKGMREFNDAKHNVKNEINEGMKKKDGLKNFRLLLPRFARHPAAEQAVFPAELGEIGSC